MRSIKELGDVRGKNIFLRADLNLPVENGVVLDDFRIKKALPTIEFLKEKGARIIMASHLSKSEGGMAPIAEAIKKYINIKFIPEILGESVTNAVAQLKDGEIILLEDLRKDPREKEGDPEFAKELSQLAEIYVNESFPVDHREDASLVVLPKLLPSYAGFQLEYEVGNLSKAFKNPEHPFLFILGGAKFGTKMPLIEKFLDLADHVFIGGALANDFLKAKGFEVGKSLVSEENFGIEKILNNSKLILPDDVVVEGGINKKISEVTKEDNILDIGEQTVKNLAPIIKSSKMILWNGPLGKYESGGAEATKNILEMIASSSTESIIGGGDTVALISEMGMEDKFSFVSTGGGATLDFLSQGTLPGIEALN